MAKASNKKSGAKPKEEAKPSAPSSASLKNDIGAELFSWQLVPLMYQKKKGIIFAIATLAFAGLVWYASSTVYALVAIVISVAASASFLLPTTYRLCEKGVEVRTAATSAYRKWIVFRKYYPAADGVLLAYYPRGLRDRVTNGLFLYYGDVDRQKVQSILDSHIDEA